MIKTKLQYFIIFPIILTFIYFYPGEIPSFYFYIPLFLVGISFIYGALLCYLFKYSQSVDKKNVMKGEKVKFHFNVSNEIFLIYPLVNVSLYGKDYVLNKQEKIVFSLNPFSHKTFDYQWECKYRGDYKVGIDYIEIKDFLGLFSYYYYIRESREIKVYPRINFLNHFSINTSYISESNNLVKSDTEDMSSISDIRKYAYGDQLRKIHWKVTAKKNEIMVKNYDNTAQIFVVLLIDLKKNHFLLEQNLIIEDQVVECIIAVIYYCLRNWIPVKLVYFEEGLKTLKGKNSLDFKVFYDYMRKVKFNQSIRFSDMINMYFSDNIEKTNMILFTVNLEYDLYNRIYEIIVGGYDITLIYISSEEIVENKNPEEEKILEGLKEIGVKVYVVQISDDIKHVLGCNL